MAAVIAAVTLAGLAQAAAQQAESKMTRTGATCTGDHWVAAWAAVPQSSSLGRPDHAALGLADGVARTFTDQTLRTRVTPHAAGSALRIRLSNRYGAGPVTVDAATVALQTSGASVAPGTIEPLTFGGQRQVVIAAGDEAVSDPLFRDLHPFEPLLVSTHVQGTTPLDYHQWAQATNYLTPAGSGDHTTDPSGASFTEAVTSSYLVSSLDVLTDRAVGAVVAIGDSITDGVGSSPNANRRWTDGLARRLTDSPAPLSVINAGIGGNRVTASSAGIGPSAPDRVVRDALSQPGITDLFVFEGINDIAGSSDESGVAIDVIAGYRRIIEQAHAAGVRVTAATITPADLPPAKEAARRAINHWIRTADAFDAVVDFDRVARDPRHPSRLRTGFDAAMAHLTDVGYRALAKSVDADLFQGSGCGA